MKLKRNISIDRLKLIIDTLNTNVVKEIKITSNTDNNGNLTSVVIDTGTIQYYIDCSKKVFGTSVNNCNELPKLIQQLQSLFIKHEINKPENGVNNE
jgi:hypothetical protein